MNFSLISSSTFLFYSRTLTERVVWSTVYSIEAFLILTVNTLALMVFLQPSFLSRKSIYFLISLTIADLMVGITVVLAVNSMSKVNDEKQFASVEVAQYWFDTFALSASIYYLTAVSLERFYAIFWPFRQRLIKTRTYLYCIGGVWLLSLSIPTATILYTVSFPDDESFQTVMGYFIMCLGLSCLATVVFTYTSIWMKFTCCDREIQANRANIDNKKLTMTLLLVILVSLATWIPNFVIFIAQVVCPVYMASLFPRQYYGIATFLIYSNSFGNFIIYTFRIKEFRTELTKIICKCDVLNFCGKCQRNANPWLNGSNAVIENITEPTLVRLKALQSQ